MCIHTQTHTCRLNTHTHIFMNTHTHTQTHTHKHTYTHTHTHYTFSLSIPSTPPPLSSLPPPPFLTLMYCLLFRCGTRSVARLACYYTLSSTVTSSWPKGHRPLWPQAIRAMHCLAHIMRGKVFKWDLIAFISKPVIILSCLRSAGCPNISGSRFLFIIIRHSRHRMTNDWTFQISK